MRRTANQKSVNAVSAKVDPQLKIRITQINKGWIIGQNGIPVIFFPLQIC
jgi:hypothetical protein